jgi:hypothetical protein
MNEHDKVGDVNLPDDDYAVFIPDQDMRAIERIICKMEQLHDELRKMQGIVKQDDNNNFDS